MYRFRIRGDFISATAGSHVLFYYSLTQKIYEKADNVFDKYFFFHPRSYFPIPDLFPGERGCSTHGREKPDLILLASRERKYKRKKEKKG